MKRTKQVLCAAMCLFMLLTSCAQSLSDTGTPPKTSSSAFVTTAAPGVSGTPSVTPDRVPDPDPLDEFLISKWDFEDENALLDKASGGLTSESVSIFGNAEVKDGILTVNDGAGSYAKIEYPFESDVSDLKNKTVIFKARINNDFSVDYKNNIAGLFSKESAYDVYFSNEEAGRLSQFRYKNGSSRPYRISESKTALGEWRVYAVAVEYSEETDTAFVLFLRSTVEDPASRDDFELIHSATVNGCGDGFLKGFDPIILGKRFDHINDIRAMRSDFAEIRVYGRLLNVDELASVSFPSARSILLDELNGKIKYAESLSGGHRTDAEWTAFKETVSAAKGVSSDADYATLKAAFDKLSHHTELMTAESIKDSVGSLTLLPYNNSELDAPIATGLHAYPGFYDIDGDGDMDFVSSSQSRSYGGHKGGVFMLYKNISGDGVTHFPSGEILQYEAKRPWFSYKTDGSPVFVSEGGYFYDKLTYLGLEDGKIISEITRQYKLYDIDGDGLSDAVFTIGKTEGENYYDENGSSLEARKWTLKWKKNIGTEKEPVFSEGYKKVLNESGTEFTVSDEMQYTYARSFSMFDWDGDGDLDLIAGGWQNEFYYYENKGDKNTPVFDPDGVIIETESGPLKLDVCLYNIINYEWSGDGIDDLFIGTESGTTKYLIFKGFSKSTGAPVFADKGYMMTDSEYLWVNALSRPTACDFDGDGDTDFIVGDNCGFFWFYENLTGGVSPSWAYPVKMRDENGNILVIKAGYNGSFQGTRECEWGYTVPVACDWDGDGDIDIVANSVTGRVVWLENIGTETHGQLTQPKPVEVEWENGSKYPSWLWFTPTGNELITQHRTTPYAMDFNGDGLCDIVMLDHEGYLAFYARYEENGVLKLKEGERIFVCNGESLRLTNKEFGQSGRIKFVVVDWDGDGLLDVIVGEKTMVFYKNIGVTGKIHFLENRGELSDGNISGHNHGFTVVDFNEDGKPDLVSGSESGYFYYFENNSNTK